MSFQHVKRGGSLALRPGIGCRWARVKAQKLQRQITTVMLRSLNALEGYLVSASDGDIACVRNFLIDDECWQIRHLVLPSGDLFGDSSLLLSRTAFKKADCARRRFHVNCSIDEIKRGPKIDADPPVALQHERGEPYQSEPYYWGFLGLWGKGPYPGLLAQRDAAATAAVARQSDPHLRSANELLRYQVSCDGKRLGRVDDFLVDDQTWRVCYVVVDAGAAWSGEKVLIAAERITSVSWTQKAIFVHDSSACDAEANADLG